MKINLSRQFDAEMDKLLGDTVKEVSLDFLSLVSAATPRDTGRAAASWQITTDGSIPDAPETTSVQSSINNAKSKLSGAKSDKFLKVTVSNNLPYIESLNEGSSDQAPAYFVERCAEEAKRG